MKPEKVNAGSRDFLGDVDRAPEREIFAAVLKKWRHRVGYCSMFAAASALLIWRAPEARSGAATRPEASVAGRGAGLPERPGVARRNPSLLKRQSEYLLPHQQGALGTPATLAGDDDCPGKAIPDGNYTAAAPYVDSGDTTGANNTVASFGAPSYCYFFYPSPGPDHVYSFTLTGRGPNPQIQVSRTSGSYEPLIYILEPPPFRMCPAGTGNRVCTIAVAPFGSAGNGTATLSAQAIDSLPLNKQLHLFVDSFHNDARGSGPYTIRMQDVTIKVAPEASCSASNPIDCVEFFVRQQYRDFLNREPDTPGQNFWADQITRCGADAQCAERQRVLVSAAFFLSIEFQETGFLAYKTYAAAFGPTRVGGAVPLTLQEFLPDVQRLGRGVVVGQGDWQAQLEANKTAYFVEFVERPAFVSANPPALTAGQYVDTLFARAGVTPTEGERGLAVAFYGGGGTLGRAAALRSVAESEGVRRAELNRAFVLMQYFGYLRRDAHDLPDGDFEGYNFWLSKLDEFNGDFVQAEMVRAFINSIEYRRRFGTP